MMTLKLPCSSRIYSSKYLKLCNYGKVSYIFLLLPVPPGKSPHQAIHVMLPIQTNLPRLHQHNNKHLLNCTFCKILINTISSCPSIKSIVWKKAPPLPPSSPCFRGRDTMIKGYYKYNLLLSLH